jgi:hypothetical protein
VIPGTVLVVVLILGLLALAALAAVLFSRRGSQPAFEFRLRPKPANRLDILKWLAVLPLVPAGPLLFFGLAWFVPGLFGLGLVFVAVAVLIWRAFAGEWPVARVH